MMLFICLVYLAIIEVKVMLFLISLFWLFNLEVKCNDVFDRFGLSGMFEEKFNGVFDISGLADQF